MLSCLKYNGFAFCHTELHVNVLTTAMNSMYKISQPLFILCIQLDVIHVPYMVELGTVLDLGAVGCVSLSLQP